MLALLPLAKLLKEEFYGQTHQHRPDQPLFNNHSSTVRRKCYLPIPAMRASAVSGTPSIFTENLLPTAMWELSPISFSMDQPPPSAFALFPHKSHKTFDDLAFYPWRKVNSLWGFLLFLPLQKVSLVSMIKINKAIEMSPWIQAWFNSAEGHFTPFLLSVRLAIETCTWISIFFLIWAWFISKFILISFLLKLILSCITIKTLHNPSLPTKKFFYSSSYEKSFMNIVCILCYSNAL